VVKGFSRSGVIISVCLCVCVCVRACVLRCVHVCVFVCVWRGVKRDGLPSGDHSLVRYGSEAPAAIASASLCDGRQLGGSQRGSHVQPTSPKASRVSSAHSPASSAWPLGIERRPSTFFLFFFSAAAVVVPSVRALSEKGTGPRADGELLLASALAARLGLASAGSEIIRLAVSSPLAAWPLTAWPLAASPLAALRASLPRLAVLCS